MADIDPTPARGAGALKGLLIALVIAAVLFVTVVLPAEFGRDPTRIGHLLGLDAMHARGSAANGGAATVRLTEITGGNERIFEADPGDGREPVPLPNPAIHQAEAAAPRSETLTVTLGPDEKTEIKAKLGKAKMLLYTWQVDGGQVYVDFHGHDPSLGDKFWVRYSEQDGVTNASGSLVAPFTGEHGWFWLNVSETPVTIHLTVTGYFDRMVDYGIIP
jgi:hypothetical protein